MTWRRRVGSSGRSVSAEGDLPPRNGTSAATDVEPLWGHDQELCDVADQNCARALHLTTLSPLVDILIQLLDGLLEFRHRAGTRVRLVVAPQPHKVVD